MQTPLTPFILPTEPIGSIPRPPRLIEAMQGFEPGGTLQDHRLEALYDDALRDTLVEFERTGSPVITDGEQRKYHNFATYCVHGLPNFAPDGFKLQFVDHYRQWPRLTAGPFRYRFRASDYLRVARTLTRLPLKQAVISPSALSLFYPADPIQDYPREQFIDDLLNEHHGEIVDCLAAGAHCVQIDFTEGRLAHKLDPTGNLLTSFVHLNNMALDRFTAEERLRLGVHTCPGGDRDSTHSADVDYGELLPSLFELNAGNFYVALARESDPGRVLAMIARHRQPWQRVFVGVIDPLDPCVESAELVCERILQAARHIPPDCLGSTDDCGFAPFSDDLSTSRDIAFAKIAARVQGTRLASAIIADQARVPAGDLR